MISQIALNGRRVRMIEEDLPTATDFHLPPIASFEPEPLDDIAPGLAEALNRLDQGVFLVDADARVVFASTVAKELLAERRRLWLGGGVLRAQSAAETIALHRLIARYSKNEVCADADGSMLPSCRIGDPPLSLLLVPLRGQPAQCRQTVVIFVADPAKAVLPSTIQLRDHFGFTAAEAALALQIVSGNGLKACAQRLGVTLATARTHLRHIFEKTGTSRQAELVRLILSSRHAVRHPGGRTNG
jgi:DNA-binding CsgD family transcriptional regulator